MFKSLRTRAAMRRHGLTAPVMTAGFYDIETKDGLCFVGQSRFNPNWLAELGITPGVIVEIGAFDGGDSHRFKTTFPDARVVATDPDPERVKAMAEILAGTGAETRLFRYQSAERSGEEVGEDNSSPPPSQTFDAFCSDAGLSDIDFLHMDLGGSAPEMLHGFGDTRPRLIFMDWSPKGFAGNTKPSIVEKSLSELGYQLVADLREDRLYRHGD